MKEYKFISTGKRESGLFLDDVCPGLLNYPNRRSEDAEIIVGDRSYQLKEKSSWNSIVDLTENGHVILTYEMRWFGKFRISFNYNGYAGNFLFVPESSFRSSSFQMETDDGIFLMEIKSKLNFKKFEREYFITAWDTFDRIPAQELLILTAVHCLLYYEAKNSG